MFKDNIKRDLEALYEMPDYVSNLPKIFDYADEYGCVSFFDGIVDIETVEMMAKKELEDGGIERLYCFLPDRIAGEEFFKIDGYANIQNITTEDVRDLKDQIIKFIVEGWIIE